ncbi:Uma2 family endonuclease [Acaryochloris sp. CCMEE 5410]|uniref:Uma2 family endonuclease n=1 Tax=Acaryochloris sp. CCMEE 5410 TaxID=310037 RepID=UPI0002483DC7|nr:Uma2 family endonuclease [Acaryochloris sp. CCMEE 5410]KAI9132499.1 Uma2 family endonuclease [Acaryochloris sp. CCMEE 5410]
MTATTYKWTVERYHQAIDAGILDDQPVELLQGDIVVMPPEGESHAYYNTEVGDYLRDLLGNRVKVRDAKPITLPNASEPAPDLAIVKSLGRIYLDHHPYPEDIFWLIEFSQTTLDKDLGQKKMAYAEAGIPEYWVVNLRQSQLIVYRDLVQGGYTTEWVLTAGMISPLAFADIQIEIERLVNG